MKIHLPSVLNVFHVCAVSVRESHKFGKMGAAKKGLGEKTNRSHNGLKKH